MSWASSAALDSNFGTAVDRALGAVARDLGSAADVAFVFVGEPHARHASQVPAKVHGALGPAVLLGCTVGGVIGGGREFEGVPAVSVLAGRTPGTTWRPFHAEESTLPDPDASPAAWHALVGVPPSECRGIVLVPDPWTIRAEPLLAGLDFAYPSVAKVGGLASGASQAGSQVLFLEDRCVRSGAAGLAITGATRLDPAVAQGCRPIGKPMRITACEGHLLKELDGVPAMQALSAIWEESDERQRALMRTSLLIGFETDPFDVEGEGPWLVRNIHGAHAEEGGLFVGETLRVGRRVRLQVRDRTTSAEDVERTLARAANGAGTRPEGALLFSCLGRGMHLYGAPDHDSRKFRDRFGDVPLGGFFCSGEIGPVGGATHLHGYTSAFGLLRPVEPTAS